MSSSPGYRLIALLSLMTSAACVVPVKQEWSDPQVNYPPTIRYAEPHIGSLLNLDTDGGYSAGVEVGLADQNTLDKLDVRWIIDYPPFLERVKHLVFKATLPAENTVDRAPIRFIPSCIDDQITREFSNHRLLLAVSDRPFESDESSQEQPDKVPDGNFLVEASWQFQLDCQ
jgi:hypothetical protein